MKNINIAFFGTPLLARKSLEKLVQSFNISLVVTKPDKERGRGRKIVPTEVKKYALERGIPVVTPENFDANFIDILKEYNVNAIVVVAFGKILPASIINFPLYGSFNLHPSLLPELRGASPIQSAILFGLKKTGVTLQKMSEKMDAGDIIAQIEITIEEEWSAEELHEKVLNIAPDFLVEKLNLFFNGKLKPLPQDESKATYCYPLKKEDALLKWSENADLISRKILAFNIWPTCYSYLGTNVLRFFRAYVYNCDDSLDGISGQVVKIDKKKGIVVKCGDGCIAITELQLQGKRRMNYRDFINGFRELEGKVFKENP